MLIHLPLALYLYFKSYISLILVLISDFIYFSHRISFSISNLDFSTNSNQNSVIFYSVDSYSSYLSKFTKIPNFSTQFIV